MNPDFIYGIIKGMNTGKRVNADGFFYGLDTNDAVQYEYSFEEGSGMRLVCPKDADGNFFIVEISTDSMQYIKIRESGMESDIVDLSTEESFFQANTVTDLVMSYEEYADVFRAFRKYYDGFLNHLTVYLWKKRK